MASTLSGQGKASRGAIHLQAGKTVGAPVCGNGDRTVTDPRLVTCSRCLPFPKGPRIVHDSADKVGTVTQMTLARDVVRVRWDDTPVDPFGDLDEPINIKHLVKGASK